MKCALDYIYETGCRNIDAAIERVIKEHCPRGTIISGASVGYASVNVDSRLEVAINTTVENKLNLILAKLNQCH